jgi:hypothetical protein
MSAPASGAGAAGHTERTTVSPCNPSAPHSQESRPTGQLALHERCAWHRCRGPFQRQRSTRRFCSTRCRVANHRAGYYAARLRACKVELVNRIEARALIRRKEFLQTCGNAALWFGLRDGGGKLWSLVGFGHGAHASGGDVVLERGWTARRAPHNSASYLISRVLRLGRWRTVKAFSDPRFGEEARVYKAVGFKPCPPSRHGDARRYALVEHGRVLSDRAIYRRHGSHAAARAAGAQLIRVPARIAWQWVAP